MAAYRLADRSMCPNSTTVATKRSSSSLMRRRWRPAAALRALPQFLRWRCGNGDFSQFTDATGRVIPVYDPASTTIVNGQISRTQFPGNMIPVNQISPISNTVMKYVPDPTLPRNFNNIPVVGNGGADQRVYSIKGDYNINDRSRLSGLITNTIFSSPDSLGPIPGPLGQNFNFFWNSRSTTV